METRWHHAQKFMTYGVSEVDQDAFDREIEEWIKEGVLVKYEASHGEIMRFLPTIAVSQVKNVVRKIRPVFN